LITVSLFFLLGGDESASTSDSPSERQVATDPNDDGGSGMDGGGETGVRGGMSGDTNPTGGSAGNTFRGGKDQLAALNGHWKRTHFYQHDDHGDMKDGIAGSIVKDLSSDTIQTGHKYYDSRSKIWIQVFRDGTSRSGTFDVLADPIHSGKFAMKLVYADGSGDWDTHKHYLSNNNTTWDQQWVTAMYLRTGETKPSQHNAERWIYVDGKTSP
jgi:hypothetical protein